MCYILQMEAEQICGGLNMSKDISIHALEKDDLEFMHQLNNDPDIMTFWFEEPYRSLTQLQNMYDENLEKDNARQFIVKKGDVKIGYVGLFGFEGVHRKAEFGIMIDKKHQGHGYASIATKLAMEYAFYRMNVRKLYLVVDRLNEKAVHVYEKMGFKKEAELEREFFVNGEYHDVLLMRIFQEEYMKN